jgi:hypothetical protein
MQRYVLEVLEGLFADDPALMDVVCEAAMTARERDTLRRPSG